MAEKKQVPGGRQKRNDPWTLVRFLVSLSRNPRLRERFLKDPDGTMAKAGLNKKQRVVVESGDPKKIRKYLGSVWSPSPFIVKIIKVIKNIIIIHD
jgi:Aromatic-ring-opening dioxygenase LigAB, LigA subunit